ncbi:trans-Golgi network integral membrane protein TGN38-like isoform X2 [Prorops nasuta]|uniref:trans-Golgi network integral membrane protein TGN38-like isoform X2 n=1 Tax=Prorops nasuta TaxID=863751 RepID=UPI0034CFB77C
MMGKCFLFWTSNTFVLFLWTICTMYGGTTLATPQHPELIFNVMKNDTNLCPTGNYLLESTFTQKCKTLEYPKNTTNLSQETQDNFLCLAVSDAWFKVCYYNSMIIHTTISNIEVYTGPNHEVVNHTVFNDGTEFDKYLNKNVVPKMSNKTAFCHSLVKDLKPIYKETEYLFSKIINKFNTSCEKACYDTYDSDVNPLCVILYWSDDVTKQGNMSMSNVNLKTLENVKQINDKETDIHNESNKPEKSDTQIKKDLPINLNKSNSKKKTPELSKGLSSDISKPLENPGIEQKQLEKLQEIENIKSNVVANNENQNNQPSDSETQIEHEKIDKKINDQEVKADTTNDDTKKLEEENKLQDEADLQKDPKADDIKSIPENPGECGDEEASNCTPDKDTQLDDNGMDTGPNNQDSSVKLSHANILKGEEESHFYTYLTVISVICVAGYFGYHNKQKMIAMILEGRRSRHNRSRRRPSTATYRKLDCNLEEAVTSECNANVTHVIY